MAQEKPPETGAADKFSSRKQKIRADAAMREKLADKALEEIVRKLNAGELRPRQFKEEARKIIDKFAPSAAKPDTDQNFFTMLKLLRDNHAISPEQFNELVKRFLVEELSQDREKKPQ